MPMLFIVGLVAYFNMQICDNLALTYAYRKPPMYKGLSDYVIKSLELAPVLMFSLGYWVLSNPQMFENVIPVRTFFNRAPDPKHRIAEAWHSN